MCNDDDYAHLMRPGDAPRHQPAMSRSVLRRQAAQRGEEMPTFVQIPVFSDEEFAELTADLVQEVDEE